MAILKQYVEIDRKDTTEHWHPECYMIHKASSELYQGGYQSHIRTTSSEILLYMDQSPTIDL